MFDRLLLMAHWTQAHIVSLAITPTPCYYNRLRLYNTHFLPTLLF